MKFYLFKKPLFTITIRNVIFAPKLIPSFVVLILIPTAISLGCWQIQRAKTHQTILSTYQHHQKEPPLSLNELNGHLKKYQYRKLRLKGQFDNQHQFLLDNQTQNGQIGYHVLTPFILLHENKMILIDRGFIPIIHSRQNKPIIKPVAGIISLTGLIQFPVKRFILKKTRSESPWGSWPNLIETIELKTIEQLLNKNTMPYYLWLSKESNYGFIRDWHPTFIMPKRNIGYAIQWFALGFTLLIFYLIVNTHRMKLK